MEIVDSLYAATREHEALEEYDFVEAPNPPADPDVLAPLAKELDLPPDYIAFLKHANGWRGVVAGWELLGTADLVEAQEHAATTFDDCDVDEEVAKNAIVIGRSENDASMLFYDRRTRKDDGRMELVEWLYEDNARYPAGIEAFFGALLERARDGIAAEKAARAAIEEEWTPAWRANDARAFREALHDRLAQATLSPPLAPERVAGLSALVEDAARLAPASLDAADAKLAITLFLYLRGAPSPAEVRASVALFRKHFPEPQFPNVARFSWDSGRPSTLTEDDPVLAAAIGAPARLGEMGITVTLATTDAAPELRFMRSIGVKDPVLSVHVPGPFGTKASASCVEVDLPLGTDPARVRALAHDVAAALPFHYGYASYGAFASGVPGVAKVYAWSRRCLGIDVRDARLELGALRDAVKNAAWLTLLGRDTCAALRVRFGEDILAFDRPDVTVTETAHGVVVEAGALALDEVRGAEASDPTGAPSFPVAVAEVDRRIAPLRLQSFSNDELHSIGGVRFVSTYTAYDGPFGDGSATRDWLERFTAPEAHLGPTPFEQGEAHLRAIDAAAGTNGLAAWEAKKKKARFSDLVHQITASAHGHETKDEVVDALAWAGRFNEHTQGVALVKLFYGLLLRGDVARAKPYLGLVPEAAKRTKVLFHNAACVALRLGDVAGAIAYTKQAKESGYTDFASMQADSDLAGLAGNPEFEALFV